MTPFGGIPLGRAIVLILICINVYKDPAFYQRFTASNGPKTGKRAMLTCFSIWLSMDVCLMFTAIVIRAMDPALTVQPEVAYMQLVLSGPASRWPRPVRLRDARRHHLHDGYLLSGRRRDRVQRYHRRPAQKAPLPTSSPSHFPYCLCGVRCDRPERCVQV